MSQIDLDKVEDLLPHDDSLDLWQEIVYDTIIDLCELSNERNGIYKWVAGHGGILEDITFRKKRLLRAKKGNPAWTYCCGLMLEHFFRCWKQWMQTLYETEFDMTWEMAKELRAYFFCYDDPPHQKYKYSCAEAIKVLGEHIKERWKKASEGIEDQDELAALSDYELDFVMHSDPYQARFGDYISMQPHEDVMAGGHSCMFVCIEKRKRGGKMEDAIRVFNTNTKAGNAYGFDSGVGFSYYWVNKYDKKGFKRIFRFGSLRPKN